MIPRSVVAGTFDNARQAQLAVDELRHAGFSDDRIGVIARDSDVRHQFKRGLADHVEAGVAIGAAGGAGVGALWGLVIASGLAPGVGTLIAGGALAAVLVDAAVGAAAGSIVGAVAGLGVPEKEAQAYESDVKEGRILVVVRAEGRSEYVYDLLATLGARLQPPVDAVR